MDGVESLAGAAEAVAEWLTTSEAGLLGAWIVAGVFLWSGLAKLRHPWQTAASMVAFGVISRASATAGRLLGGFELVLGATIATAGASNVASTAGSAAACVVLIAFAIGIAQSLRAGRRFECSCFGHAGSTISGWTLARTAGLAVLAGAVTIRSASDPVMATAEHVAFASTTAMAMLGCAALLSLAGGLVRWNAVVYHPDKEA